MLHLAEASAYAGVTRKKFLRHLTAILTASWPEKIFLLHQSIFSHVCISVFMMRAVFTFDLLLDGDMDNKLSEQDSIIEIYLHYKT